MDLSFNHTVTQKKDGGRYIKIREWGSYMILSNSKQTKEQVFLVWYSSIAYFCPGWGRENAIFHGNSLHLLVMIIYIALHGFVCLA